jgi:predicted permease
MSTLKLNASKVNFLVFSSFEKKLKIQKIIQMHQIYIFFRIFCCLFAIFWFFSNKIRKKDKKSGYDKYYNI